MLSLFYGNRSGFALAHCLPHVANSVAVKALYAVKLSQWSTKVARHSMLPSLPIALGAEALLFGEYAPLPCALHADLAAFLAALFDNPSALLAYPKSRREIQHACGR